MQEQVGVTETIRQLHDGVSSGILAATKNARLYPENHPVVTRSIDSLRETLGSFMGETGDPFCLEMDAPEIGDDAVSLRSMESSLKSLLRRHLIRRAVLLPEVTREEIFQFCFLLREDLFAGAEDDSGTVHPEEWEHIRIEFYEAEALPEGVLTQGTLLEAAAGVRQVKGLQAWLEKLPGSVRMRARDALKRPAFLRELSEIRRIIKEAAAGGQPMEGNVDLISEVLSSVMPRKFDEEKVDQLLGESLGALKRVADSLRQDRETILGDVDSMSGSWIHGAMTGKVVDALSAESRFFREMSRLQQEKQRLAYVFRTTAGEDSSTVEETPAEPPPEGGKKDRYKEENERRDPHLEARFKGVTYDLDTFRGAIRSSSRQGRDLRILLELLAREEHRDRLRKSWKTVLDVVAETGKDPAVLDANLELIVDFVDKHRFLQGEDLLSSLLERVEPATRVYAVIEKKVLPRAGVQTAKRLLGRVAEGEPARAVPVLVAATRGEDSSLKAAARSQLISLAEDASLLVLWVEHDPGCFSRTDVMNLVRKTPTKELFAVFQKAFSRWETQLSCVLLKAIKPGVEGMDQVLLAAAIRGPLAVRQVALRQLPLYQSPTAVDVLTGIVNENNEREHPCIPEVDAALEALRSMADPRATEFLHQVANSRRWLRFQYRKEIRDALSNLAPMAAGKDS